MADPWSAAQAPSTNGQTKGQIMSDDADDHAPRAYRRINRVFWRVDDDAGLGRTGPEEELHAEGAALVAWPGKQAGQASDFSQSNERAFLVI